MLWPSSFRTWIALLHSEEPGQAHGGDDRRRIAGGHPAQRLTHTLGPPRGPGEVQHHRTLELLAERRIRGCAAQRVFESTKSRDLTPHTGGYRDALDSVDARVCHLGEPGIGEEHLGVVVLDNVAKLVPLQVPVDRCRVETRAMAGPEHIEEGVLAAVDEGCPGGIPFRVGPHGKHRSLPIPSTASTQPSSRRHLRELSGRSLHASFSRAFSRNDSTRRRRLTMPNSLAVSRASEARRTR